jgi:lipoate---protein ligase
MIDFINHSFDTPAENLAFEEVLLRPFSKTEGLNPMLRIWENKQTCVVIGRAEEINKQVHLEKAKLKNIPVIRRVSGGGTVIHGPGNLNCSFFLPYELHENLNNIKDSYCLILNWVIKAIESCADVKVKIKGTSDLVIADKKISGTAQSRKRFGLLHHLTLLWDIDFNLCEEILKEPEKRPDYRDKRIHSDFITTFSNEGIQFSKETFVNQLCEQFGGKNELSLLNPDRNAVNDLVKSKYGLESWNEER